MLLSMDSAWKVCGKRQVWISPQFHTHTYLSFLTTPLQNTPFPAQFSLNYFWGKSPLPQKKRKRFVYSCKPCACSQTQVWLSFPLACCFDYLRPGAQRLEIITISNDGTVPELSFKALASPGVHLCTISAKPIHKFSQFVVQQKRGRSTAQSELLAKSSNLPILLWGWVSRCAVLDTAFRCAVAKGSSIY